MNKDCILCQLIKKPELRTGKTYYENSIYLITEDKNKNGAIDRIMGMTKEHLAKIPRDDERTLKELLITTGDLIGGEWKYEVTMRSCKHWHAHIRRIE